MTCTNQRQWLKGGDIYCNELRTRIRVDWQGAILYIVAIEKPMTRIWFPMPCNDYNFFFLKKKLRYLKLGKILTFMLLLFFSCTYNNILMTQFAWRKILTTIWYDSIIEWLWSIVPMDHPAADKSKLLAINHSIGV